jgi:hypothetical protein
LIRYTHPESYSASVETFVQNMTRELQHWQASLPRDLEIDMASAKNRAYLPSVIMLQYVSTRTPELPVPFLVRFDQQL